MLETLVRYAEWILDYLLQMLPCMGLGLLFFLLVRPLRLRRLDRLGLESPPLREGALALFVLFCAGLAAVTVFPDEFWRVDHWSGVFRDGVPLFPVTVDWREQLRSIQLNIFQEIRRAVRGPWVMFLLLANIGVFLPVGFFPALLWRGGRLWKALLTGAGISLAIEAVQLFLPRISDIDDVILNTTGAVVGYGLCRIFRALFPGFAARFQVRQRDNDRR